MFAHELVRMSNLTLLQNTSVEQYIPKIFNLVEEEVLLCRKNVAL